MDLLGGDNFQGMWCAKHSTFAMLPHILYEYCPSNEL